VVDELIPLSPNLVAGANEEGYHLRNVNYARDYTAEIVTDITAAQDGDPCLECGGPLRAVRGVEVGNIFKLGTRYSDAFGCTYQDQSGQARPVIMGSYGIGTGRLLACVAEAYHDDYGLAWPVSVAPYHVHIVVLPGKNREPEVYAQAEWLYESLQAAGVEVLMDDRDESPGVKFNDADLIGLPIRLTVSDRGIKSGGIEFKRRDSTERSQVPVDAIVARVQSDLEGMLTELEARKITVAYNA
jgi:prolyl-tRNA synthetase